MTRFTGTSREAQAYATSQADFEPPRTVTEVDLLKSWEVCLLKSREWIRRPLDFVKSSAPVKEGMKGSDVRPVADVDELGEGVVRLSDGTELVTDAVVCATGWKARPPIKFSPEGMDAELGLPSNAAQMFSQKDVAAADAEIFSRFPKLREQPKTPSPGGDTSADDTNQPFTLYRFMAPPKHMLESNDIAFAGMITTISTPLCAHLQALWITAYLSNTLSRLPSSTLEAEKTALLHSRFGRWRYACGYGARFPDFVFDAVPYLDMLLRDLGIKEKRKGGWLSEIFEAYGPEDYKGVVGEWSEMQKKEQ